MGSTTTAQHVVAREREGRSSPSSQNYGAKVDAMNST